MAPTGTPRQKGKNKEPEEWKWDKILQQNFKENEQATSAPVLAFEHAPLHDVWEQISLEGTVGEISCNSGDSSVISDSENHEKTFWYVEVLTYEGYFCRVRFLGCTSSRDSEDSKPVGLEYWVHMRKIKPIEHYQKLGFHPTLPFVVTGTLEEIRERTYNSLVGKFRVFDVEKFLEAEKNNCEARWSTDSVVEVLNSQCCSEMRIGVVKEPVDRRLYIHYQDDNQQGLGIWLDEDSDYIQPVGWCDKYGGRLMKTKNPHKKSLSSYPFQSSPSDPPLEIQKDMVFEMINPIKMNDIVVGRVTKVLPFGYFLCEIISPMVDEDVSIHLKGNNEFHFHWTSEYIFPIGTCAHYGVDLVAPRDADITQGFSWGHYFEMYKGVRQLRLRHQSPQDTNLRPGMWIEAVDFYDTKLVCVAKVQTIMNPYAVKVRFAGWGPDIDQWKPLKSKEIFPIGWCELVGYRLTPPGSEVVAEAQSSKKKKKLKMY